MIRGVLTSLQFDAEVVFRSADSSGVAGQYDLNSDEAVERGVLGVPAYLLNGEQFWGQDRIELLAETIDSQPGAQ